MKWRNGRGDQESYTLEVLSLPIKIAQRKHGELSGLGTGGNVWNAAIVYTKYLEKRIRLDPAFSESLSGYRILELGSGTGIVGISFVHLFPNIEKFIMTDQKQVLPVLQDNMDRNMENIPNLNSKLCYEELEWGSDISNLKNNGPFDLIIACDCIAPIFPLDLLLKTLIDLCSEKTKLVLAYEHRQFTESFFEGAYNHFNFDRVDHSDLDENFCDDDMDVYYLTKKI